MINTLIHQAAIHNPALDPFKSLIGEWKTVGTHPYVPDIVFHGYTYFDWNEGGAFIIMHSEIEEREIPDAIAIFGSDDSTGQYFMLYFDERKVSRKYDLAIQDNILQWWRNSDDFSQRNTLTFSDNGNTIIGKGEMCRDGKNWEKDLSLTYTRIR